MNEIVVDASLNQIRVALLEDEELSEIYMETDHYKRVVGNIYKGRVTNVLPGMQAAFVDMGLEKNGFLYVKDAIPYSQGKKGISIKEAVKNGQEIIVQVTKEPMGTKGARVTTHLTLPGRYLVLMPGNNYVGISRRIEKEEERDRLRKIIEQIRPQNVGIIIRTAGEGKEEKELKDDLKFLLKLWQKIEKEKKLGFAPRVIYKDMDLLHRTVRDSFTQDIDQFIINDKEKYKSILELVELIDPNLKDRVKYFNIDMNIFDHYKIESMISDAISRRVWLKSGGYLVIDQTEALTVIDVNTGKYVGNLDLEDTITKTNKEAAQEIAKQLRLRDIGGIIIVDFIDMDHEDTQREVLEILQKSLLKDRTKTNVLGITQLGLVEMTRKKIRGRISSIMQKKCPYCEGTGRVLSEYMVMQKIEKEVKRIAIHTNSEGVLFEVSPTLEKILSTDAKGFMIELENLTNIKIFIQKNIEVHDDEYVVKTMGKIEKIKNMLQE
ncbi:Rne/Rng family ribonuclease [Inediibacterium massiliense]|uniref:Rne/Rng family ribonuclease n=1 Tax=Inediibacterium massiliense TaxID=1658111 RepID=UPI0006B416B2|nr:Rne/Rng family ribonuclease [Inediibacterium massiliense]